MELSASMTSSRIANAEGAILAQDSAKNFRFNTFSSSASLCRRHSGSNLPAKACQAIPQDCERS